MFTRFYIKYNLAIISVALFVGVLWSAFAYLAWLRVTLSPEPIVQKVVIEEHFIGKCMDVMKYVPDMEDYDDARDWRFSWCVEQNNIRSAHGE